MAYVVTFVDYQPPPRFDGGKWTQAQIFEAPGSAGPWTSLETKVIADYPDAQSPPSLNFTTELATLPTGWYKITFRDATGDFAQDTAPVHNIDEGPAEYMPSIATVGALLRARTLVENGDELGTFTSATRPTAIEADNMIRKAAGKLSTYVGDQVPDALLDEAKELVALRAAMMIELSYYPEQVVAGRSPYDRYKELWDEAVGTPDKPGSFVLAVQNAVTDETVDVGGGAGEPHFSFPENDGGLVGWETKM